MLSRSLLLPSGELFSKSSSGAITDGSEQSEGIREGLGWVLACLLSSESLRFLGDKGPFKVSVVGMWLVGVGLSCSKSGTGVSDAALKGDFCVRAATEGRPGATLGLTENRFRLWTAAEVLVPSPFWSLPSLKNRKSN